MQGWVTKELRERGCCVWIHCNFNIFGMISSGWYVNWSHLAEGVLWRIQFPHTWLQENWEENGQFIVFFKDKSFFIKVVKLSLSVWNCLGPHTPSTLKRASQRLVFFHLNCQCAWGLYCTTAINQVKLVLTTNIKKIPQDTKEKSPFYHRSCPPSFKKVFQALSGLTPPLLWASTLSPPLLLPWSQVNVDD